MDETHKLVKQTEAILAQMKEDLIQQGIIQHRVENTTANRAEPTTSGIPNRHGMEPRPAQAKPELLEPRRTVPPQRQDRRTPERLSTAVVPPRGPERQLKQRSNVATTATEKYIPGDSNPRSPWTYRDSYRSPAKSVSVTSEFLKHILETEKVVDRGFETARVLKERVEELEQKVQKPKRREKRKTNTSHANKSGEGRVQTEEIGEGVKSGERIFVTEVKQLRNRSQQTELGSEVREGRVNREVSPKRQKSRGRRCPKCSKIRENVTLVNIERSQSGWTNNKDLMLQKLPSLEIKNSLVLQKVHSIDIPPDTSQSEVGKQNTGFTAISHIPTKPQVPHSSVGGGDATSNSSKALGSPHYASVASAKLNQLLQACHFNIDDPRIDRFVESLADRRPLVTPSEIPTVEGKLNDVNTVESYHIDAKAAEIANQYWAKTAKLEGNQLVLQNELEQMFETAERFKEVCQMDEADKLSSEEAHPVRMDETYNLTNIATKKKTGPIAKVDSPKVNFPHPSRRDAESLEEDRRKAIGLPEKQVTAPEIQFGRAGGDNKIPSLASSSTSAEQRESLGGTDAKTEEDYESDFEDDSAPNMPQNPVPRPELSVKRGTEPIVSNDVQDLTQKLRNDIHDILIQNTTEAVTARSNLGKALKNLARNPPSTKSLSPGKCVFEKSASSERIRKTNEDVRSLEEVLAATKIQFEKIENLADKLTTQVMKNGDQLEGSVGRAIERERKDSEIENAWKRQEKQIGTHVQGDSEEDVILKFPTDIPVGSEGKRKNATEILTRRRSKKRLDPQRQSSSAGSDRANMPLWSPMGSNPNTMLIELQKVRRTLSASAEQVTLLSPVSSNLTSSEPSSEASHSISKHGSIDSMEFDASEDSVHSAHKEAKRHGEHLRSDGEVQGGLYANQSIGEVRSRYSEHSRSDGEVQRGLGLHSAAIHGSQSIGEVISVGSTVSEEISRVSTE